MQWTHDQRSLDLLAAPAVMGILNVTPDSYYDGGAYTQADAIVARAQAMLAEGADLLDIGGESTGPGSLDVSLEEERRRVVSAVQAVRHACPQAWISVDTSKAAIAREALGAGADMINDVTAGRGDAEMFAVVAAAGCPIVLMHAKDPTPRTTVASVSYDDVTAHVRAFLAERIAAAKERGVAQQNIIIDPGLGHFVSADPQYSFTLLRSLERLHDMVPVLVSPSRKSFLAGPRKLPPKDRLEATLAATGIALEHGARIIRTHDVAATVRVRDALSSSLQRTTTPSAR